MIQAITLSLGLFASAASPALTHAQAPGLQGASTRMIRFVGVLTDAAGGPLTGSQLVTFTLFDAAEGGAAIWTETLTVNADQRGRYAAHLGSTLALPQDAFSTEEARWVATTVAGRELPRTPFVAVPYALKAGDADTLGGQPASSFVRSRADGRLETAAGLIDSAAVDGSGVAGQLAKWVNGTTLSSSVISESASNRVGFGLTDPTGGGVVDSVFTIKNFDNNTGFSILNASLQRRFAINTLANGGWQIYDGAGNVWNAGLRQLSGNISLGTENTFGRVSAVSSTNNGLWAETTMTDANGASGIAHNGSNAFGIYGASVNGYAGFFSGKVHVSDVLSKGAGAFKIDHPLDPTNKYLQHSFVESPDMMNVYNGNVTVDANGEAWVTMPEWFEALNRDFRYQLTSIGGPASPYIAAEMNTNRFKIAGGLPGGKVSWQVTGVRQDAFANAHRIVVEENKPEDERGTYMHPDAFGQPATASLIDKRMKQKANGNPAGTPVKK